MKRLLALFELLNERLACAVNGHVPVERIVMSSITVEPWCYRCGEPLS